MVICITIVFYFDIGFVLNKKIIKSNKRINNDSNFLDWKIQNRFKLQESSYFYPNDRDKIGFQQNSQNSQIVKVINF